MAEDRRAHHRSRAGAGAGRQQLAAGRGVSDIANELSLSVKTVSTYRSRILEKMSFTANADITSYALRNGLIQ